MPICCNNIRKPPDAAIRKLGPVRRLNFGIARTLIFVAPRLP